MKISYAITVCNEYEEIQKLISTLMLNIREEDEVIVLFDKQKGTAEVWEYLVGLQSQDLIKAYPKSFKGHFADWKNLLSSFCTGDYIFQIDADEIPSEFLLKTFPQVLESNAVETILVPRVNTVEGLTDEHIQKWRWNVNEKGWVNWPDVQTRIYRRTSEIEWEGKVHERIKGYNTMTYLPIEEDYALYHPKDIQRQEKQNALYETI